MAATLPMDLAGNEDFAGEISAESPDYTSYELLPPGTYINASRELTVSSRVTKKGQPFMFADIKVSQLQDENGRVISLQRPIRTFINTLQFSRKNQQGSTSEVATYLKELGFDPKQLKGEDLKQALLESASYPVKVVVGWTNMAKKNPDGSYGEEWAKTADFNVGTPDEPRFTTVVEKDGESYRAKHRIVGFRKVA